MNKHLRTTRALGLTVSAVALLTFGACSDDGDFDPSQQFGADPVLPEPEQSLLPDMKVAAVTGWDEGETPTVPEGLTVTPYAQDLGNPRTVHTLPNGDVLVVQSKGPSGKPLNRPKDYIRGWIMSIAHGGGGGEAPETNRITLLRDTDRDGTVDERSDLLTDLASPFGVAWIDDTLYVASTEAVISYPYQLGDSEITAEPTVLTPLPGGPINHHWTKDLALSPDGQYLYASVGSNSNIVERGLEAEKGRAAIWEIDRETGAARVYASGLRNPNGLTFHPETGELWAVINERDELGPNLVPDYLTSVQEDGFYGWPWSYYGQHVDERVMPHRPDMVEKAISPDYALSSHVAALGLEFSYDSALPEAYANGAFIGEHGSWNRDHFSGYHVVYVPFENGKPAGDPVEVVTGFLDGDNARGRPVGVGIDGTGALLVADDAGNTVWRVAASDGSTVEQVIGTDRVGAQAGQEPQAPGETQPSDSTAGTPDEPVSAEPAPAAQPSGTGAATPPQTDIAPAVRPQGMIEPASPQPDASNQ
ncbi:PQQ-dependent sugar dehydrogenase [Fulvimarina sp. 2208YS6-2-32]|uniref:PQQ-dependent sugar dehydrogenase n=1 Tax=Fulvimarina uroteuthidis TaxID=3098149 RepID=A0ABU5HYA2_9HYPH|nr:PQQ-dependent sugar dehydrogenase [Fulvimarina sp. 2208YS6-2-32]MDY8108107.1 PQQ-dependent sugar dehydrogenase [Fulvimarina sp. 2208YS6-2-32]